MYCEAFWTLALQGNNFLVQRYVPDFVIRIVLVAVRNKLLLFRTVRNPTLAKSPNSVRFYPHHAQQLQILYVYFFALFSIEMVMLLP